MINGIKFKFFNNLLILVHFIFSVVNNKFTFDIVSINGFLKPRWFIRIIEGFGEPKSQKENSLFTELSYFFPHANEEFLAIHFFLAWLHQFRLLKFTQDRFHHLANTIFLNDLHE